MSAHKPGPKIQKIEFRPGQVWSYQTRPQEPDSTVMVLAVDGNIVHIFIEHLKIADPLLEDGVVSILSFPVDRVTLGACVVSLLREDLLAPDYEAARQRWAEMHDPADRSAFDIPLAELLELTEESLVERALETDN